METNNDQTLKQIIDEIDRENFTIKRIAEDRRRCDERRLIPRPRYTTIREGIHMVDSEPMTNPATYVIEIAKFLRARDKGVEIMVMMLLNEQNMNLGIEVVATGTVNSVIVAPRQVFDIAFNPQYRASGFILAHNHPSGDSKPSLDDLKQMLHIKRLGDHLDCTLKDFIVVGIIDYYSARNESYVL